MASRDPSFLTPLLKGAPPVCVLRNERTAGVVASTLIPAFDSESRRTGLLKHDALPDESVLLIAPTSAIHTFFMRFPIDVAFVRKDGTVVKTYAALGRSRIAFAVGAYAALELAAGRLGVTDTRAGDRLAIVPAPPPPRAHP